MYQWVLISFLVWSYACVGGFNQHDAGGDADISHDASKDADDRRDVDDVGVDADDLDADRPEDTAVDADDLDAEIQDADRTDGNEGELDADTEMETDAETDAEVDHDEPSCVHSLSGDTLAWYEFEGDIDDETGLHHGVLHDPDGCLSFIEGPERCGEAIFFPGGCLESWIEIEHTPEWDDVMSIDFWLWQNPAEVSGVLSRDASSADRPGHITVAIESMGRLYVRIQRSETIETTVCSEESLADLTWIHVGINLGFPRLELWIDGVLQAGSGSITIGSADVPCDGELGGPYGIDGNENPWVIGGITWMSEEGSAEPVTSMADATAIDQLRFSSSRQDFSQFP